MNNLFIVHTPYHLLLSVGTILYYKLDNNDIMLYETLNIDSIIIEKLKIIFNNVIFYNSKNISYIKISKLKTISYNMSKKNNIKKLIKHKKYENIFIFNDSFMETQYIINKMYKKSNIFYIEDGSVIYLEKFKFYNKNYLFHNFKKFLLFGFNYEYICNGYGIHNRISKKMVLWPQLVSDDFKEDQKEIIEIKKDILINGIKFLYNDLYKFIHVNENKKIVLIILEHIDYFKRNDNLQIDDYKQCLEFILLNLHKKYDIYIKYHPRDDSFYLKELNEKYNINYIEKYIPIEMFYTINNVSIISVTSTSLFTAKKILNTSNVISLCKLISIKNIDIIDKFERIGIKMPSSNNELIKCIVE